MLSATALSTTAPVAFRPSLSYSNKVVPTPRKTPLLLALLCLIGAHTPAAHAETARPASPPHRPWIWEAERKGAKIYLAGCLHLGTAQDAACFSAYLPYYERAWAVYFEVLPGAWQTRDVSDLLARRGYVSRSTLESRLTPPAWRELCDVLGPASPLLQRVTPCEPWFAALTLTQEGYRRAGLLPENGLDTFLTTRALGEGKRVGALEKPRDQLLAMADAPLPDQERNLRGAVAGYRTSDGATTGLRQAWRRGELAPLQKELGVETAQPGETHRNLLGKRNELWTRKISSIATAGKPLLVVVGVEHFVTRPDALPELLEREGFKVRRITQGPERLTGTLAAE
jgi:uncharacterized protein YbaP (TraB family)